jgi:hypothetical protein
MNNVPSNFTDHSANRFDFTFVSECALKAGAGVSTFLHKTCFIMSWLEKSLEIYKE